MGLFSALTGEDRVAKAKAAAAPSFKAVRREESILGEAKVSFIVVVLCCAEGLRALGHACQVGTFDGPAAEIATGDAWMRKQFLCASFEDDLASFEHIG